MLAYLPDEPIAFRAQVTETTLASQLTAVVSPVSYEAAPITVALKQQQLQQWEAKLNGLPEGLYRVAVGAKDADLPTVHSLFEVVKAIV